MAPVTLYPVAIARAVTLVIAAASWLASDRRWTGVILLTGIIQALGYVIVSRALFYTSQLLPQQWLFATLSIALTTKIIVFSPGVLAQISTPRYSPGFSRETLFVGLAASWLIQTSLALLFLFPTSALGDVLLWVLPFSPVSAFAPLFAVGVILAQVTIASGVYDSLEATDSVATAKSTEPTPEAVDVADDLVDEGESVPAATDGGRTE
jgi:hypothetical protein